MCSNNYCQVNNCYFNQPFSTVHLLAFMMKAIISTIEVLDEFYNVQLYDIMQKVNLTGLL